MDLLKRSWVHFVIAGLLLGGTWILVFGPKLPSEENKRIIISENNVNFISASWQKTWQRPPTKEELSNAVLNYVRDEVLYREALNRNFDENNGMVRRSLIMQMNMIAEGQGSSSGIDEESIAAYYELRKEKFMIPALISFRQVYFNPSKHNESMDVLINRELRQMTSASEEEIMNAGDPISLDHSYKELSEYEVASRFGEDFASEIMDLPTGEWIGPVKSSYGVHLVYILSKKPETPAPLSSVRNEIIREIEYEEKEAAKEQFYTELMRQYSIVYEGDVKDFMESE